MTLTAERGAKIDAWVYVVNDKREQSLIGESDAVRLGIMKSDLKGSTEEVMGRVSKPNQNLTYLPVVSFQVIKHRKKSTRR